MRRYGGLFETSARKREEHPALAGAAFGRPLPPLRAAARGATFSAIPRQVLQGVALHFARKLDHAQDDTGRREKVAAGDGDNLLSVVVG